MCARVKLYVCAFALCSNTAAAFCAPSGEGAKKVKVFDEHAISSYLMLSTFVSAHTFASAAARVTSMLAKSCQSVTSVHPA